MGSVAGDHTLCIRFAFHEYTVELIKWSGQQRRMGCFQKTTRGRWRLGGRGAEATEFTCYGLVLD